MSVACTVPEVIRQHVILEVESTDRMYLNVYQPELQSECGVASFLRFHRGHTLASSAPIDPISKRFGGLRRRVLDYLVVLLEDQFPVDRLRGWTQQQDPCYPMASVRSAI